MKRILRISCAISLIFVFVFANIWLINYVDSRDMNIESSASADIYEIQEEMSMLYLLKIDYEEEKTEIEDKISALQNNVEASDNELTFLSQRLLEIEEEIVKTQSRIDALQLAIDDIYLELNNSSETNIVTCTYLTDGDTMSTSSSKGCGFKVVNRIGNKIIYNASDIHGYYLTFDSDGKDITLLVSFVFTLKSSSTAGTRSLTVNTNSNLRLVTVSQYFDASTLGSIVCSPVLLTLPAGNNLRFMFDTFMSGDTLYGLGSDNILRTFMTIEVVS